MELLVVVISTSVSYCRRPELQSESSNSARYSRGFPSSSPNVQACSSSFRISLTHPDTLHLMTCTVWCDFDRASSLICRNKMPTRCNRGFYCRSHYLLNMFRAPLCPSAGAQEYYTVVAACGISCCGFSSCWSGVALRVMCPVCRMLCIMLLSSWWWA